MGLERDSVSVLLRVFFVGSSSRSGGRMGLAVVTKHVLAIWGGGLRFGDGLSHDCWCCEK